MFGSGFAVSNSLAMDSAGDEITKRPHIECAPESKIQMLCDHVPHDKDALRARARHAQLRFVRKRSTPNFESRSTTVRDSARSLVPLEPRRPGVNRRLPLVI